MAITSRNAPDAKGRQSWPYGGSYWRDWGVDLRAEWLHGVVFESSLIDQPAGGGSIARGGSIDIQMCTHSGRQGTKNHFHMIHTQDHKVELRKSLGCPKCAEELRGLDILMRN